MGSKRRIAKQIIPIITETLTTEQYYVELFCDGCNLIDKINHPLRIANDVNAPLIALWKALQNGWIPPEYIDREQYYEIWQNQEFFDSELVGFACFCCSFSSKPFSGFAAVHTPDTGVQRNYQLEAKNNVLAQIHKLKNVQFHSLSPTIRCRFLKTQLFIVTLLTKEQLDIALNLIMTTFGLFVVVKLKRIKFLFPNIVHLLILSVFGKVNLKEHFHKTVCIIARQKKVLKSFSSMKANLMIFVNLYYNGYSQS